MGEIRMQLLRYTNPRRVDRLIACFQPYLIVLAIVVMLIAVFNVVASPPDYQQGVTVKLMYLHVPFAWLSMMCYLLMSGFSILVLIFAHPITEISLRAAAPIGATFTGLTLVTGSIWGRPTWGTWWEWDARMTSVLILFFIYLAIIALSHAFADERRSAQAAAILTLFGLINLPIIKFSVNWWNTLHQPASLLRFGRASAIDPAMMRPLVMMTLGFILLFLIMLTAAIRNEILRCRIDKLRADFAYKKLYMKGAACQRT